MNTPDLPKLALIAGPTASGKSALALALAERHDGVVINADASQVYADLRILSARPSPEEEARAPHRLFGHVDGADADYSVARWADEARAVIAKVHAAGRLPIVVGGSGLYIRTLIDGIAPVPAIDPAIRAEVRAASVADNHAALTMLDPAAATRLHTADTTRVARALEVVRSTGRTLAAWQVDRRGGIGAVVALRPLILLPPRDWLVERCRARSVAMLEGGAIAEVRMLQARPDVPPDAPVMRAIGVREIGDGLAAGRTRAEMAADLSRVTERYAKRQYTWFRNQPPAAWSRIKATEENDITALIGIILRE